MSQAMPVSPGPGPAAKTPLRLRIAAVLACLAPIAMAVVAAVALAGDVAIAVLAVALLLVASAAIWVALTTRGGRRALGTALAALAGAGLIAVVATHWQGVLVLVALLALLGVFGLSARYALRRTGEAAVRAVAATSVRVGAAGSAVLIMNLKSGGGKAERFDLAAEARQRDIEPIVLQPGDDMRELAESAIARGAEVVGMAGGDGSQALVATVAARHGVAHVCIPAGTRNHFALDLGLDRDDVVGALDAFGDGVARRIDLAFVNDRIFVNNVSLGIYAEIVRSEAYRDAKLETMEKMLPALIGPEATPFDLQFEDADGVRRSSAQLVLVSNNPYILDRLAGMGSRPRLDTGRLGIVTVEIGGAAQAAKLASLNALGQIRRFEGWTEWSADRFEVASGAPVAAGIDGEASLLDSPLRFRIAPAALEVRLPPTALGLSPAAVRPGLRRDSLGALWELATGRRRQ